MVRDEKLMLRREYPEDGRSERYFWMMVVFAVPLSPTKRIGRRGARAFNIALKRNNRQSRNRDFYQKSEL